MRKQRQKPLTGRKSTLLDAYLHPVEVVDLGCEEEEQEEGGVPHTGRAEDEEECVLVTPCGVSSSTVAVGSVATQRVTPRPLLVDWLRNGTRKRQLEVLDLCVEGDEGADDG